MCARKLGRVKEAVKMMKDVSRFDPCPPGSVQNLPQTREGGPEALCLLFSSFMILCNTNFYLWLSLGLKFTLQVSIFNLIS